MYDPKLLETFIEVKLKNPDDFLKVRETLTRIGIASRNENILYQSCHILHKQSRYYVVSFKELFLLDGKMADFSDEDKARRNLIAKLLAEWGLVELVDPVKIEALQAPMSAVKVLPHKEKDKWSLVTKYTIGNRRKVHNG
jgi:hypothetical protein